MSHADHANVGRSHPASLLAQCAERNDCHAAALANQQQTMQMHMCQFAAAIADHAEKRQTKKIPGISHHQIEIVWTPLNHHKFSQTCWSARHDKSSET
jgi:hypothetical protein